jgi:hypothetical protein
MNQDLGAQKKKSAFRGIGLEIIAAGRIVVAGGVPAWVGAHAGFADAITDNGAGDYTVTLNASLATYTGFVLATSQTLGLICNAVRASNTTLRLTQRTDAGVLTDNGSIDVCVVTSQSVKALGPLKVIAAGRILSATASVVGTPEWSGAHPGFGAVLTDTGVGQIGVAVNAALTGLTAFVIASSETADTICSVVRTGANAIEIDTESNLGAATDADVDVAIFGFEGIDGPEIVAAGRVMGADGSPAWDGAPHPGFGDAITDNGAGDYQVASNHDLGNFTGIVVGVIETTGGHYMDIVRTSDVSLQVLSYLHDATPTDVDLNLIIVSA